MPRRGRPTKRMGQRFADKIAPSVHAAAKVDAGHRIQRLLGFWVAFHVWGGQDNMIESGHWSRAGVYGQRNEFFEVFSWDVADVWPESAAAFASIPGYRGPPPKDSRD